MKCHTHNGAFIPGCMGAAAACGCGKSLREIKSYCTCKAHEQAVKERIDGMDKQELIREMNLMAKRMKDIGKDSQ